jgi:hypothetical protein
MRRIRTLLCASALTGALTLTAAASVLAERNPAGTGQPGAECGEEESFLEPPGFLTDGFAIAEARYAGSDGTPSLANANSSHAVSQYDIACVQFTASQADAE